MHYFIGLAHQVFFPWWWFVLAAMVIVGLLAWRSHVAGRLSKRHLLFSGLMPLFPALLLIWGTLREHTSEMWAGELPSWEPWEGRVLDIIACLFLPSAALTIWASPDNRSWLSLWTAIVAWWVLLAWFTATMSITGDWL